MSETISACSRSDCAAPSGGTCAAGHTVPADCPNAQRDASDTADPDVTPQTNGTDEPRPVRPEPRPGIRLGAGSALTREEANALAAQAGARIMLPLGPSRVGKTTLMVELYERYLKGPWGETSFAWSDTLLEFERLAFAGRLNSGADIPDTWRTRLRQDGRSILHLRVVHEDRPKNLLFVNLPGELSDRVRNGRDPAVELPLLTAADRVAVCVDGELVAKSPGMCDRAVSHTQQLVRVLAESATFSTNARLALVLTKWDYVSASVEGETRWAEAEPALLQDFERLGRPHIAVRLAARATASTPSDDGMDSLLRWLIADTSVDATPVVEAPSPARAMGRFGTTP